MAENISESLLSNTSVLGTVNRPLCDVSINVLLTANLVINCVLNPLTSVFGIFGNVFTIIILTYNGLNESTNIILTGLAMSDLLFSVTGLVGQIPKAVYYFDYVLYYNMYNHYVAYIYGWNQCTICISVHMVTLIAIERFIAVCFPFVASSYLKPSRIKYVVIAVFLSDGVFYIPRAFLVRLNWEFFSGFNSSFATGYYTDFATSNGFFIYNEVITSLISIAIPTVTIIICSFMISIKLTTSYRNMKKMAASDARSKRVKDVRSVKITLAVCICMIIFVLAPTNTFFYTYSDTHLYSRNCRSVINTFIDLIYQINSSINFIIYVIMSPKFANTYKKLFVCG